MLKRLTPLFFAICLLSLQLKVEAQWERPRQKHTYKSSAQRFIIWDQSLKILEKSNPMDDLRKALRQSDVRFVGYRGRLFIVPGLTSKQVDYILRQGPDLKVLRSSSDVIAADLQRRSSKVAQIYMKPYNTALLRYLANRNRNKNRCFVAHLSEAAR